MDEDNYDEFGNYIGPDIDSDPEVEDDLGFEDVARGDFTSGEEAPLDEEEGMAVDGGENRIVLAEDKKYYPEADEVYGNAKTILLDEDAQDLDEPIINPMKIKNFSVLETVQPELTYNRDFITNLMDTPALIRNVGIIGQLHHGKTTLLDTLVQVTQENEWDNTKHKRYSDTRKDEQSREMSIKSCLVSLALESLSGKSHLINFVDCPGHINFEDEVEASMRAVDGAILVVDAIEGCLVGSERAVRAALRSGVQLCLVINKVDRLILELKIPPADAYYKLVHVIQEANALLQACTPAGAKPQKFAAERGNVCFASAEHGWSFTPDSFAQQYCEFYQDSSVARQGAKSRLQAPDLAKRLWGDWYYDKRNSSITKKKPVPPRMDMDADSEDEDYVPPEPVRRTFIHFVLEPLYKIYSHVLGDEPQDLAYAMQELDIKYTPDEIAMDPRLLLKCTLHKFFGYPRGLVDMLVQRLPSPLEAAGRKVQLSYTGYQADYGLDGQRDEATRSMLACSKDGPLVVHVSKLFNTPDGQSFHALGRIMSGVAKAGMSITVLGENYTDEDKEDSASVEIDAISVGVGRFTVSVSHACAGNLVLLEGVDGPIKRSATLFAKSYAGEVAPFSKLTFDTTSVMRLAVEPLKPSDLPKMIEALRKIGKSYPLVSTKVEESGEHVILGLGELALDCVMHDLRHLYSDIEVKVADPVVSFCETCVESSALKCTSTTSNQKNSFTLVAEPLDSGLGVDVERGLLSAAALRQSGGSNGSTGTNTTTSSTQKLAQRQAQKKLQTDYDWDLLSARSVWAFGPEENSPNVFLDDTLPGQVDKAALAAVRDSLVQGFRWAAREGPLCDEPMRDVKFKMLDASIANEPIYRGGGQVIPTARRIVYSSFLTATPRLMEPIYSVEIQCPADTVQAIRPVLSRRRGHIVSDLPKPGAPFYVVKAFLPGIESFGFETDLRSYTQGQAYCQSVFSHWNIAPGDPLDGDVILHPLEPSPALALARDFMIKTRRRKGLSDDISVVKYFDDDQLMRMKGKEEQ